MTRELWLVATLAISFGLGAYRGTGEWGAFSALNVGVGAAAGLLAAWQSLRRAARRRGGAPRGVVSEPLLQVVCVVWAAALVQQAVALSDVRFDWTFEGRFQLAPATVQAIEALPGRTDLTLYTDPLDPRRRRTRLLLDQLAAAGDLVVRERSLGDAPEEEDYFAIRSSNTVVLEVGDRWERVDRPTEGSIFEALSYLGVDGHRVVYVTSGAGEGDPTSPAPAGFSGLAAALETEGIELRQLGSAEVSAIPDDADAVLSIAPERRLHTVTLDALRRYLEGGGSLVAMLEPGRDSGVEQVLAEFGITPLAGVVVDPASGSVMGERPGLNPIVFNYSTDESITQGLDSNRRVYFRGARSFRLRKPRPDDRLRGLVFASGDSWIHPDAGVAETGRAPERPADARTDYHPLVVSGRYERGGTATRIVAFGDSGFAANAHLRSLYNLDLAMNAMHWALRDEPRISLRPKAGQLIQFPVPIQNSLKAFYGVGLLLPELMLLSAGWIWLRRRTA
ncbi:MAG: Gldg family protein [Myxococcota bacterium]